MGKGNGKENVEAKDTGIPMGEFRIGRIGKMERFRGYIKFYPENGGWILRIPPGKVLIIPDDKDTAKELGKIYKDIEKEKLGKILKENWKILENYGVMKENPIVSKKRKKEKKEKKSIIDELRELPKEERIQIINELLSD